MRSYASVMIGGKLLATEVADELISIKLRDAAGQESDTCEIVLNDIDDQFVMPERGASIEVELSRDGIVGAKRFEGIIDNPRSQGSRGGGQVLVISAKAADMRGELKIRKEKHLDDATFEDAAKKFAPQGVTIKVHGDLGQIRRNYWYLGRVNFPHWAQATARELGATFKMIGKTAVFVPRNSGQSASGKPLLTVHATRGVNIISWDMGPDDGRHDREQFEVSWYDAAEAQWKTQDGKVKVIGEGNTGTYRFSAPDQDTAKQQANALKREKDREKGGGTVIIDGDPTAQAEAECIVTVRPGISGTYQIDSAEDDWTRSGGWITTLELKTPGGNAGTDDRE